MAHTLTWTSDSPYYAVFVNGYSVESPYSLKNGDTIYLHIGGKRYTPQPGPAPVPRCNNIFVNCAYYIFDDIALSDTDISVYFSYLSDNYYENIVNINYSESGGGWQYA